ncbi:TatD family hydrolase [Herbaspirillum sp. LeCh32-8]|uniref:TatD family hydrolase n=1 Tax=Herbaspirillum sp. LeCh32-8 TaxID=2821356 RepID=UPI001AE1A63B|nr:TatD family hydrolase [Herbaspirillum sp. LeCh32-8]MBP0599511.1 TatD family hydrolase [Herbaspirillum sp. LeCh32-8]
MWVDTHCHLDAGEFGGHSASVADGAAQAGVRAIVIPAIARVNFGTVAQLAREVGNGVYALGIHPLYVPTAKESDLDALCSAIEAALHDPLFVGIGEIGLDFFVPALKEPPLREKQEFFFAEQLKLARDFELPVLLHVRRSQDIILKHLRRIRVPGGIAHAFNGSFQQAQTFIELGLHLGFGGAMTFPRSLQIRRLAAELPLSSLVLETDAPDISPAWRHPDANTPDQIPRIGEVLAELRNMPVDEIAAATTANALAALPRLASSGLTL